MPRGIIITHGRSKITHVDDAHEHVENFMRQVEEKTLERSKIVFRWRP